MKPRNDLVTGVLVLALGVSFAPTIAASTDGVQPPAAEAMAHAPATDLPESVVAQLKRANSLFEAQEYRSADVVLRGLLADPHFVDQSDELKLAAYMLAAGAALALEDTDRAWTLLDAANASPAADVDVASATLELALDLGRPEKAIAPIRVLAAQSPEQLRALSDRTVYQLKVALWRQQVPDAGRVAFLQAFFDAGRLLEDGRQPDGLWLELARLRLAEGDVAAATAVARRITGARQVLALQVDRRFDRIVAALDPAQLDLSAALQRELDTVAAAIAREPRSLQHVVELTYLLLDAGRYQDTLAACDTALAQAAAAARETPAFDDEDDSLIWIHDNRARALIGLGRIDEAVTVWEAARRMAEGGGANVSQAINVAGLYGALGRPREALDALAGVADASPYGWMQYHAARVSALQGTPDDPRARESLAYVREHKADAPGTHVEVLVETGALDEASVAMRERLADQDERAAALLAVQNYIRQPLSPLNAQRLARMRELVERPEVAAAIDAVGRVIDVPLHESPLSL